MCIRTRGHKVSKQSNYQIKFLCSAHKFLSLLLLRLELLQRSEPVKQQNMLLFIRAATKYTQTHSHGILLKQMQKLQSMRHEREQKGRLRVKIVYIICVRTYPLNERKANKTSIE